MLNRTTLVAGGCWVGCATPILSGDLSFLPLAMACLLVLRLPPARAHRVVAALLGTGAAAHAAQKRWPVFPGAGPVPPALPSHQLLLLVVMCCLADAAGVLLELRRRGRASWGSSAGRSLGDPLPWKSPARDGLARLRIAFPAHASSAESAPYELIVSGCTSQSAR